MPGALMGQLGKAVQTLAALDLPPAELLRRLGDDDARPDAMKWRSAATESQRRPGERLVA
ncbi:hypothetical protein ADK76_37195 [Streptomyces griseoflavus]|nr:hypothetical protein ADK76_37195 [Streptomyces griseoflavus]